MTIQELYQFALNSNVEDDELLIKVHKNDTEDVVFEISKSDIREDFFKRESKLIYI